MQLKYNWENLFSLGFTTEEMYRAETEAKAPDLAYVSCSTDALAIMKVLLLYFSKENILHFFCVAPYVFKTDYDLIMKRIKQLDDLCGKDWPNLAIRQLQSQEDVDLLYLLAASDNIFCLVAIKTCGAYQFHQFVFISPGKIVNSFIFFS